MKSIKLLLAAVFLCVTQFAMAITPLQQGEIDALILQAGNAQTVSQQNALANQAVALAAQYGADPVSVATSLYNAGLSPTTINSAFAASTYSAPAQQGASNQVASLSITNPHSGPTGAGTTTTTTTGGGTTLSFTPTTCSGVSKC